MTSTRDLVAQDHAAPRAGGALATSGFRVPALPRKGAVGGPADAAEGADRWCLQHWLDGCRSDHTRRAYRREASRWLAFLAALLPATGREAGEFLLRSAVYEDADRYFEWILQQGPDALPAAAARAWDVAPGPPSATLPVLRMAVTSLHTMYARLMELRIGQPAHAPVAINPFSNLLRTYNQRLEAHLQALGGASAAKRLSYANNTHREGSGAEKALSEAAWGLLWEVASTGPQQASDMRSRKLLARQRLALAMLRGTWERRSAAAELTWADLVADRATGLWHVLRKRKGGKVVKEPVPKELIDELVLFRRTCELPIEPNERESGRSIYWVGGSVGATGPISDQTFYRDVKAVFSRAVQAAAERGEPELARELGAAGRGPHAIRHTMATQYLSTGGQARLAQAVLGHSSLAITTRVYDTKTAAERGEAVEQQWDRSGGVVDED